MTIQLAFPRRENYRTEASAKMATVAVHAALVAPRVVLETPRGALVTLNYTNEILVPNLTIKRST